jgi:hypothetical protein
VNFLYVLFAIKLCLNSLSFLLLLLEWVLFVSRKGLEWVLFVSRKGLEWVLFVSRKGLELGTICQS